MSDQYRVRNNEWPHFITTTTVGWVDVFSRRVQKERLVESLAYCQKNKGLIIFAWCLMSNHLHMICQSKDESMPLASIIRDLKTYSSKQIIRTIKKDRESRRKWMLPIFREACVHLKRRQRYKVWQNGYHAIELYSQGVLEQKLIYIHMNPVKAMIVERPEDYLYSSARNYAELKGLLDVENVSRRWYYEN